MEGIWEGTDSRGEYLSIEIKDGKFIKTEYYGYMKRNDTKVYDFTIYDSHLYAGEIRGERMFERYIVEPDGDSLEWNEGSVKKEK